MGSSFLWVKALHIVFVSSWFAGLFYLPRLFVNLASVPADSHAERERLLMMARKLYRFSGLLMVIASMGRQTRQVVGIPPSGKVSPQTGSPLKDISFLKKPDAPEGRVVV